MPDVTRWYEQIDKQNDNEERGETLKLERELKRLKSSVNYSVRNKRR